ncbi:YTH domain-containing protein 1 [Orchesella cincta]|uniref:YTH domain-containing protein 1 n=1 Tax=Orchesella cincta TaxID=48709 RepID=A0A1D2MHT0_ORCCI|nr:YTH domain-containing protein 1 [Orchesella cincta]
MQFYNGNVEGSARKNLEWKLTETLTRLGIPDSYSSISSSSSHSGGSEIASKRKYKGRKSIDKHYKRGLSTLFQEARFFLMKSCNEENIAVAKAKSVWATLAANEVKLKEAFNNCKNVILIFSVKESGKFSGFARLASRSSPSWRQQGVNWLLPAELSPRRLGGLFHLDWISKSELSFGFTHHLYNPWNEGKPVKIGRDGQEIHPDTGAELCRLFPFDPDADYEVALRRIRRDAAGGEGIQVSCDIVAPIHAPAQGRDDTFDEYGSRHHDEGWRGQEHPWHPNSRPLHNFNSEDRYKPSLSRYSMDHGNNHYGDAYFTPTFPDHNRGMFRPTSAPPMPPYLYPPPAPFNCFPLPSPSYYHHHGRKSNVKSRLGPKLFKILR